MFFKDMVTIHDFEAKDVISMIKFAYKEELPKFCYNAELARLADKYDYQSLFNRCIANLCKNIHRKNVFSHLFTGYLVNSEELLNECSNFLSNVLEARIKEASGNDFHRYLMNPDGIIKVLTNINNKILTNHDSGYGCYR